MSFDWSHYLDLAQELFTQAASSQYEDANLRSAISRAYYATYHKARLSLHNKWGISVPADASAHMAVRKEFKQKKQKQKTCKIECMPIYPNKPYYTYLYNKLTAHATR